MARSLLRQDAQIQPSQTYTGSLAAGNALQQNAISLEDDLNSLRSQVNRILDQTGAGNWYDDIATVNSKQRALKQLNAGLDTLETKPLMQRVQVATNIAVPANQNYVVLSVGGGEAPSPNAAVATTALGSVAAKSALSGAAFAAHELTAITGQNAVEPKNLALVRVAGTHNVAQSGDLDVYALVQLEGTGTDGTPYNDTVSGNRVKLSFVTIDFANMSLQAADPAMVGGKTINYAYPLRTTLANLPEQAFIGNGTFTDNVAAVDVTLARAVVNQAGAGVPVTADVLWRLASGKNYKVQNAGGTTDFYSVSATGATSYNVPSFAVASAATATFTSGQSVATATQAVNLGVTAGQVDSAGLTLNSTGANALKLVSGNSINLKDAYQAASTWASSGITLAGSSQDWSNFKTSFGEVSILAGIRAAAVRANHSIRWATVTAASIPSGTNITGAGAGANIDTQLFDLTSVQSVGTTVKVYVNGQLLRYGATLAAGNDWAPGSNPANGDIVLAFRATGGARPDVLTMEIFFSPLYEM